MESIAPVAEDEPQHLESPRAGGQVVRFSPDGNVLAAGSRDEFEATLWDVGTGTLLRRLKGKSASYYREGLTFTKRIASNGLDDSRCGFRTRVRWVG